MKYILILSLTVVTSACVVKQNPAKTEVIVPGVAKVSSHCPPGQANKGNC